MPVDPYAALQALLRAEASRARRADRSASEPAGPASEAAPVPAPEPPVHREDSAR
ncbi:hypothetical protein ACH4M4_30730 [Streptomyces sp. NPDC017254]|uniref:hypothetical protein n=1 Tax=unclassified Streptomyces TaxID=2593676 RepID=UPI00378F9637